MHFFPIYSKGTVATDTTQVDSVATEVLKNKIFFYFVKIKHILSILPKRKCWKLH